LIFRTNANRISVIIIEASNIDRNSGVAGNFDIADSTDFYLSNWQILW